jgi:hypothetical protein
MKLLIQLSKYSLTRVIKKVFTPLAGMSLAFKKSLI